MKCQQERQCYGSASGSDVKFKDIERIDSYKSVSGDCFDPYEEQCRLIRGIGIAHLKISSLDTLYLVQIAKIIQRHQHLIMRI